jgi:hypothetical protein
MLVRARLWSPLWFILLSTPAFAQGVGNAIALDYKVVPDWLKLPEGRTEIGAMHGDVAVSSAGEVYISVEGSVRQRFAYKGPIAGLQVYAPDGTFLRNVPNAPSDLHGFIIHNEAAGEFLYGARLAGGQAQADQARAGLDQQAIIKMTLDGTIVQAIPASAIPHQFKNKAADGRSFMRLTQVAVTPNGDIYATDGYASDYIHRFDRTGRYVKSFGGKSEPYGFKTLHKIAIDTRFTPARIIACDRGNGRVVHLSLDGAFLGVIAEDLNTPAAVAIHGDYAAIAELRPGRITSKTLTGKVVQVTILDKAGKVAAVLGTNMNAEEIGIDTTDPSTWRPGAVMAPHGVAFNDQGDLFVAENNLFGRVHRFNVQRNSVARQK